MSKLAAHSHLRNPLTRLLGNSGNIRVLRALVMHGAPLSTTQLASDTALTPQGVRLVLDGLVGLGVVIALGTPRSQLFALKLANPFARLVKGIFEEERALWESLMQGLKDLFAALPSVQCAWLYGSVARGDDSSGSDIDLAILLSSNKEKGDDVRGALELFEERFEVRLSPVLLTPREAAKRSATDRWWSEVCRDAKVLKGRPPGAEVARSKPRVQPA